MSAIMQVLKEVPIVSCGAWSTSKTGLGMALKKDTFAESPPHLSNH